MQTIKYKCGYIHINFISPKYEIIRVQVDAYAYPIEVKSIFAGKLLITKHHTKLITKG